MAIFDSTEFREFRCSRLRPIRTTLDQFARVDVDFDDSDEAIAEFLQSLAETILRLQHHERDLTRWLAHAYSHASPAVHDHLSRYSGIERLISEPDPYHGNLSKPLFGPPFVSQDPHTEPMPFWTPR